MMTLTPDLRKHSGDVHDRHPHVASVLYLGASSVWAFADASLPRAKPEDVGLSSERLARIGETLKADIEAGRIPVVAIARRGKLSAAPGPIRWHYRQKINALVYQAIVE